MTGLREMLGSVKTGFIWRLGTRMQEAALDSGQKYSCVD